MAEAPEVVQPEPAQQGGPWAASGRGGAARQRMLHAANQIRNTLEQRNTYCYKNIDYNNQIRVLKIFPGRPGTPIHCCLIPCKLFEQTANSSLKISDSVPYAALSYFWGNDEPEEEIRVFATEGGYYEWRKKDMRGVMLQTTMVSCLLIRTNLHNALQQLRSEKDPVVLWADALCINQRNVLERTAQVSRMHDVYTQAERVCIWLGKGKEPDNKRTFEFLNKILDLYELEQVVQRLKDKKADSTWLDDKLDCKKTLDLMGAEWFRRRWVIQELALARSAFVLFGSQEMPWLDFADAIALFMTKFDQIKLAFPASTDYVVSRQSNDNYIKSLDARALGANVLVTATSNLFRKSSSGQVIQRLLSLELLVSSMLLVFEATDPRDTVFAVLQIAKDISTHHRHTRLRACRGSLQSYAPYMLVIVFWKLDDKTLALYGDFKSPTTDIALRNLAVGALVARSGLLIFIGYLVVLLLKTLIVWLLSRMLVKAIFGDVASSKSKCKIDKRIEANYRKCLRDVCADFIEYCIEDSKSLDIICRHWAPIPKPSALSPQMQMPSWILPIGGNAFGRPDQVRKGRVNGDSFVGPEKGGYYTASGTLTPQIEFGTTRSLEEATVTAPMEKPGEYTNQTTLDVEMAARFDGTLKVKGFQLGTIEETERVIGPVVSREALKLCGWSKTTGASDAQLDQVWRVLVANRGPNGTNPPDWYRRACRSCLEWYNKEDEDTFNTNTLKDMDNTPRGKVEFLKRVQQVLFNRNIITARSSSRGLYVGVGPLKSKIGDIVCILYGCSVPVVLSSLPNGEFRFLGESYIHGVMDGEAVEPTFERGREQRFKLS